MQQLIPAILYASFIQTYAQPQYYNGANSQYQAPTLSYTPSLYPSTYTNTFNGYGQPQYNGGGGYNAVNSGPYGQYLRSKNLREPQPPKYPDPETYGFELDYPADVQPEERLPELDSPPDSTSDEKEADDESEDTGSSYYEDLELIDNFANYLKRRTNLESSTESNDPARQYNALLGVIVALARAVKNTCSDVDELYDQIYEKTVETYFQYGLANAEKITALIEDYIQKGIDHLPKIIKLRHDLCEKELFCSSAIESKVKDTPLFYVKELETLEALAHLARAFYPYMDEFNDAARDGNVLAYLQKSKDRIKDYVMSVVNAVDHLTDRIVKCDK